MKKHLLTLVIALSSTAVWADKFEGFYVGTSIDADKLRLNENDQDKKADFAFSYGAVMGVISPLSESAVGALEIRLSRQFAGGFAEKSNQDNLKQNLHLSFAYLQGYQVYNFLPYVKAGISNYWLEINQKSKDKPSDKFSRFGYDFGVGLRIAFADNLHLSGEYNFGGFFKDKSSEKDDDYQKAIKRAKGNHSFSANLLYKF